MRYYSTQRPVTPGSFPKPIGNKVVEIHNYDSKTYCEEIGREAWGYVEYERPISFVLAADFELTPSIQEKDTNLTPEELELLRRYSADILNREYDGSSITSQGWVTICRMKDRTAAIFNMRYQAAREVIDIVARQIGIDPENSGRWLYTPDLDGSSPIARKMDEYFSRSGDKVKLKKRIEELEQENRILRTLITKQEGGHD